MLCSMRLTMGWGLVVAAAIAAGCGDNGGGSASATDSASASGTTGGEPTGGAPTESGSGSMSATDSAEGGISESLSGSTGAEGGNSESLSQSGGPVTETMGNSGGTEDTGMISGGGDTSASSSTGAPIVCTEIDNQQDCLDAGCAAISGQHFGGDEAMACLEASEYLACGEPTPCAEEITTVCDGEEKYQLPNTCAPEGWVPCMPPPDQGMNGYPDCP